MRLNPRDRKQINNRLRKISSEKYDAIPLDEIFQVIEDHGCVVLQEDNTKWSGFLCGREQQTYFPVALEETEKEGAFEPVNNAMLALYWYQFETGRYEVIAYIS